MSEWISVEKELPGNANSGVDDAFPVLVMTNEPYGSAGIWNVRVTTWMNNRFCGYPSGATKITHWMPLPEPPSD